MLFFFLRQERKRKVKMPLLLLLPVESKAFQNYSPPNSSCAAKPALGLWCEQVMQAPACGDLDYPFPNDLLPVQAGLNIENKLQKDLRETCWRCCTD